MIETESRNVRGVEEQIGEASTHLEAAVGNLSLLDSDDDDDDEAVLVSKNDVIEVDSTMDKFEKDKQLLSRMLDLEQPVITDKMIQFLTKDSVCQLYIQFISQLNDVVDEDEEEVGPLPVGSIPLENVAIRDLDNVTVELTKSYRATMLLAGNEVNEASDSLITFLGTKCKLITKCMFKVFQPNSPGNLRHGCLVLDRLLRFYTDDVYETIGKNGSTVGRYLGNMLEYVEHAPVAEQFITTVCKPHTVKAIPWYNSSAQIKWKFFRALSDWKLFLVLSKHVASKSYSETHSVAAADVMTELLNRVCADENGQLLLQPIGHCPELIGSLIQAAFDTESGYDERRTAALGCIASVLEKSARDEVVGPPTSPYHSFGTTMVNMVKNQLASLRKEIYKVVESYFITFSNYMVERYDEQQRIQVSKSVVEGLDTSSAIPQGAVRHTSYVVKVPFTEFRMKLVNILVLLVTNNPQVLKQFTPELWRVLIACFFDYPHNNMYHAAFFKLLYLSLRANDEDTLSIIMKKLKLVTSLINHYESDGSRTNNRGYILYICNVIRLQVATIPPDSFLRSFLKSHATWRKFEPVLREDTLRLTVKGLGIPVPCIVRPGDEPFKSGDNPDGIDLGSDFAKSLGFSNEVAWPLDASPTPKKQKKKKKSKRKSSQGQSCDDPGTGDEESTNDIEEKQDDTPASTNDIEEKLGDTPASTNDIEVVDISKKKKKKKEKKKNSLPSSTSNGIAQ